MGIEIERKFLVVGDTWRDGKQTILKQGYLNRDKQRTVRVRIADEKAFITIKGITTGISRTEFEYEIPITDATTMLALCDGPLIEKTRYIVHYQGMTWEIDEFHGMNSGLVVAEIELQSSNQIFTKPDWVSEEVTHDKRYFNSNLSVTPFSQWAKN